jgi:predicted dehydrogenase
MSSPDPLRVGIIGCGAISANYLRNARNLPVLKIVACADLIRDAAAARAEEFGVPRVLEVDALLADAEVEAVLNLTIPAAHAPVAAAAIRNGKHVYNEKPFAADRAAGRALLDSAAEAGVRLGCAPDTVLGAGFQTARQVLDSGRIGRPVAFTGQFLGRGPEGFHPNPRFFYKPGAGPMFDMGPYYVTALLNLLGPIRRIMGAATIAIPERTIARDPESGAIIQVETPDHICGAVEFECGAVGTLMTSFAVGQGSYDREFPITIYGTEGTLRVPDPNTFDGRVLVRGLKDEDWSEVPHAFVPGYGRSVGLADLAYAVRSGREIRCSGAQGFAVLDTMQGFLDSASRSEAFVPEPGYQRPAPMPEGLPFGTLDL